MKKRFVIKISEESSEEEIRNLLSEMTGLKPSDIQISEFLENRSILQNQKLEIKKIINPFFDQLVSQPTKESKKKLDELIDLGKFLYFSGLANEVKLIECGERPDFIVKYKNDEVGIEHTGIFDDDVIAEINTIKKSIAKCEEQLRIRRSDIKGLFNIVVLPEKLKALTLREAQIIESTCSYIVALNDKSQTEKPEFIFKVIRSQRSVLELTLGEDYWLANLTPEGIRKTMQKKEDKVDTYKSLRNIKSCWLLIVMGGASSSSSFDVDLNKLPKDLVAFDKVFLFDNFKGKIIEGKKND